MGRGIALLFHDHGTRSGWVVSSTPWPHFTPGKDWVPILQEAGWAPGPVWTGGKSRSHWDLISNCPAHSQSLYWLSYLAHLPRIPCVKLFISDFSFTLHNIIQQTCLVCTSVCSQKNCYANMHCSVGLSLIGGYSFAGTCSNKRPPICLLVSCSSYQVMRYGMYLNSTQFLELLPSCFNNSWNLCSTGEEWMSLVEKVELDSWRSSTTAGYHYCINCWFVMLWIMKAWHWRHYLQLDTIRV